MPLITWVLSDGRRIAAQVNVGDKLMEAASFEQVPGIDGDCGGCLSCATCHVVVDAAWAERVGQPDAEESSMLECTAASRQAHSRLSCQLTVAADWDGLLLHVPKG